MPAHPKLTLAIVDKICQQVTAGMSLRGAFRTAGAPARDRTAIASGQWFTGRSGFAWLRLGNDLAAAIEDGTRDPGTLTEHEELCVELALRIEQGKGLHEAFSMGKLQSGTGRDAARWQWILERKLPDEYKGTQRVELTGADGGPVATVAKVVLLPPLEVDDDERAGGGVAPEPGPPDGVPVE